MEPVRPIFWTQLKLRDLTLDMNLVINSSLRVNRVAVINLHKLKAPNVPFIGAKSNSDPLKICKYTHQFSNRQTFHTTASLRTRGRDKYTALGPATIYIYRLGILFVFLLIINKVTSYIFVTSDFGYYDEEAHNKNELSSKQEVDSKNLTQK